MAKDDMVDADLPSRDAAKEFYAKYEPKEALGRWADVTVFYLDPLPLSLPIIHCKLQNWHQNHSALGELLSNKWVFQTYLLTYPLRDPEDTWGRSVSNWRLINIHTITSIFIN